MAGRSEGLAIELLWQAPGASDPVDIRGGLLPPELADRFPGELAVCLHPNAPTIVANMVSSIDGVVALGPTESSLGGSDISGASAADRYMMALLRGLADAVIVGAGTTRHGHRHVWAATHLEPRLASAFAAWRSELWLAPQPTTIVVSASGNLDATHSGFNAPSVPVIVATTTEGAERLSRLPFAPHVKIEAMSDGQRVPPGALVDLLNRINARVAVCEGGPHLFGELLRARLIDDLFMTIAPQALGRDATLHRLGLVEDVAFSLNQGRWAELVSVRQAGDDVFLRYRFEG